MLVPGRTRGRDPGVPPLVLSHLTRAVRRAGLQPTSLGGTRQGCREVEAGKRRDQVRQASRCLGRTWTWSQNPGFQPRLCPRPDTELQAGHSFSGLSSLIVDRGCPALPGPALPILPAPIEITLTVLRWQGVCADVGSSPLRSMSAAVQKSCRSAQLLVVLM